MASYVKFIVYANGNIVNGANGPKYDRDPTKVMKVRVGSTYADVVCTICQGIGIDSSVGQVEILHRLFVLMATQAVSYRLSAIQDNDDFENMIEMAIEHGGRPVYEIYVKTSKYPSGAEVELNTSTYPIMENHAHSLMLDHQQVPQLHVETSDMRQVMSYNSPVHNKLLEKIEFELDSTTLKLNLSKNSTEFE